MTNKNYTMIPVLIAALLIPQLLFLWLVPYAVVARLAVYVGGTVLTIAATMVLFITYWKCGLRRAVGLAVMVGVLELIVVIACAILVVLDASIRSSVYALSIIGLIHLICMIPMTVSALRPDRVGVSVMQTQLFNDTQEHIDANERNAAQHAVPDRTRVRDNAGSAGEARKALPPRNR